MNAVEEDRTTSTRRIGYALHCSKTRVHRTLKREEYYPCHNTKVQNIKPIDHETRLFFSNWFCDIYAVDPNISSYIMFTDEARLASARMPLSIFIMNINGLKRIHMV